MYIYKDSTETIIQTQYADPQLNHITKHILSRLHKGEGKYLLDIGCGVGRIAVQAAKNGWNVVGFDIEKKAIAFAKAYAKKEGASDSCTFLVGDEKVFQQSTYSKLVFDAIICSEVIEHIQQPEALITFAYTSLKKQGICIFTTPHDPALWSPMDEYAQHVQRFTLSDIKKLFSRFVITDLYTIGFPFMRFAFRLYSILQKKKPPSHTPVWRQGFLNSVYNRVMLILLRFDDIFNRMGKGTTIIVVAQKR